VVVALGGAEGLPQLRKLSRVWRAESLTQIGRDEEMGDLSPNEGDYPGKAIHPSKPFGWVAEFASYEAVMWAVELSDIERRRHLLEFASRGPISGLDTDSLARLAALVAIARDRRALGLE
jgi:hypothetical protein